MKNSQTKKVLYINLEKQEAEVKLHEDYAQYLGGVGLGFKIVEDSIAKLPLVFSIGPLNGFFPYASKTAVTLFENGYKDYYLGGSLSTRIKFTGLDSIVLLGESSAPVILEINNSEVKFLPVGEDINSIGLPGKRCVINMTQENVFVDDYFKPADSKIHQILIQKKIKTIVVTGTESFDIPDSDRYQEVYDDLLSKKELIKVDQTNNPSCSGCPMGCNRSQVGEKEGDFLVHSLVACAFAEEIYSDINIIFSCLDVLGYGYTHEDIEKFPSLIYDLLEGESNE